MHVLVVEDDPATRRILSRLVESSFGATVAEAENGLEALALVEETVPDFVITDVHMPVLDGFGLLQAIRSSQTLSHLPVVVASAAGDRRDVTELIKLGVSEYLLKPLDISAAAKRLAVVVSDIRSRPRRSTQHTVASNGRQVLLLADPDPNFRELFTSLFSATFDVVAVNSGPAALRAAHEREPAIACLGEGLGLLSEQLLVGHLRRLPSPPSAVYLVHSAESAGESAAFDGTIRRSFVPEVLLDRWRAATGQQDLSARIAGCLEQIESEVLSAAQQTLGVMTQHEVEPLPDADLVLDGTIGAMVRLVAADAGTGVTVAMCAGRAEAEALAGAVFGEPVSWDAGGDEAFGTLVETMAGRLRSSFDARQLKLEQQAVEPFDPARFASPAYRAVFATGGEGRFGLLIAAA